MAVQPSSAPCPQAGPAARRRCALIVDGHGWASRAVVRSLGSAGWRVLAPAGTKSARSNFCSGTVSLPDCRTDIRRFAEVVRCVLRTAKVDVVVPGEDASLEVLYGTVGLLGSTQVLGGDRESAWLALDKRRTLTRARQAGFSVPASVQAERVDEAVATARDLGFPCVVKPSRSFARAGNTLRQARLSFAADRGQLRRAIEHYLALGFEMPLVQEWVRGRSIGVAAVLRRGRVLGWGAREAFSQVPIRGGSAVWRATVGAEEHGVNDALSLLRVIGFEGLGDVQYHIAADGTPTLMEIGARTYGWLPLTIAAGANLPLIAARALDGEEPAETVVAQAGLHMRWPRGEAARILEVLHPRPKLPPGATRRDVFRQLWPLFGSTMLYDGLTGEDRYPRLFR